jgi:sulfate transport system ATP-binding protein
MFAELRHINKRFGNYQASREVSFGIRKGSLTALLGPSGSGKTTILRMIAGLEQSDSGDIFIDGTRVNDFPASKRGIGFVFQNYALFRYMTVFDNIAFGLVVQKKKPRVIIEKVKELLSLIGMEGLAKRYPAQLSGGQKQRVAFARALAPNPRLLLLDEPFAAIDAKVRQELRAWLREMITQIGITSIFVTHDQDEAIEVADEILVINAGRVEQKGKPIDLYRSPATPFVAKFIGKSSTLEHPEQLAGFETIPQGAYGTVRPEFIKIYAPDELIQYQNAAEYARVESVIFRGDSLEVGLSLKNSLFSARYSLEHAPLNVGDRVRVLLYRLYVFEGEKTRLMHNAYLQDHPQGYSYSI